MSGAVDEDQPGVVKATAAVIDAPPGWTKDAAGNWVQSGAGLPVVSALNRAAAAVAAVANPARLSEASTYAGAAVGISGIGAGDIESLIGAVGLALAGDFPGAVRAGCIPLLRLGASAAAIFIPESKVMSDEQIKTAVGFLSREQLVSLLDQSVAVSAGAGAGNSDAAGGQSGQVSNAAG